MPIFPRLNELHCASAFEVIAILPTHQGGSGRSAGDLYCVSMGVNPCRIVRAEFAIPLNYQGYQIISCGMIAGTNRRKALTDSGIQYFN